MEETKIIDIEKLLEKNATRQFQIEKNKTKIVQVQNRFTSRTIAEMKEAGTWDAKSAFDLLVSSGVAAALIGEDVEGFQAMIELDLRGYGLTEVDLTFCPHLEEVLLNNNHLQIVDLSKNKRLRIVSLANNELLEVDFAENFALERLDISENVKITSLNVSHCRSLKDLFFQGTKVETLDLSKCSELVIIDGSNSFIQEINLSNSSKLAQVLFNNSKLQKILLPSGADIAVLDLRNSLVQSLDISKTIVKTGFLNKTLLNEIRCTDEQIAKIEETDDEHLGKISVSNMEKIKLI